MDTGDWTSLLVGAAGVLVGTLSIMASVARRRAVLIVGGVLVLVALGIGAVDLLGSFGRATGSGPRTTTTATAAPVTSSPAPPHEPATAPAMAGADPDPQWSGTVRLTSLGLDLDALPTGTGDGTGNELMLKIMVGGPLRMMVFHRAAVWQSPDVPSRRQCAERLATQPLDRYEGLDLPVKDTALCMQTTEDNLVFFRVTDTASAGNGPYSGVGTGVVAEVMAWRSAA